MEWKTNTFKIRFLSPCLSDVTAKAKVIKLGRTLCPVSVDLFDAAGKHVAVAQVNYIILDNLAVVSRTVINDEFD